MPTYNMDQLESKYSEFRSPAFEMLIDGESVVIQNMEVGWVEVDLSKDAKADIARFSIVNAFDWMNNTLSWVDSKIAPGKNVVVKFGYKDKMTVVFDGLITGYTIDYPSNKSPILTITAMDRSFLMMKTSGSRVWKQKKESDVVRTIASEYGLTPEIDNLTIVKETIEQVGISDFHFVQSLANDNGYQFYVSGTKLYFQKYPTGGSSVVQLDYGHNLIEFTFTVDVTGQTSEVIVKGFDVTKKQAITGKATGNDISKIGGNISGPGFAKKLSSKKVETFYSGVSTQEEATHLAKATLNRMARDLIKAQGTCIGFPEMLPGQLIEISGIGVNRKLRLTRVIHRIDSTNGYLIQFEAEGNAL